jgi:hypothetical protein
MAHMQLTSDIRGRDNDSIGLFVLVGLSVKIIAFDPKVIDFVLKFRGLI